MTAKWADERVETLVKLFGENRTASQIAAEIGGGLTRNAVIGKLHRLGLRDADRPVPTLRRAMTATRPRPEPEPAPQVTAAGPPPRARVASKPVPIVAPPPKPKPSIFADHPAALAIEPLTLSTCRWPLGDSRQPGFRYCCAPVAVLGKPYCPEHRLEAMNPVRRALLPTSRHGSLVGRAA